MALATNQMMSLFVLGVILAVGLGSAASARACPQYCLDVDYVTCPFSGNEELPSRCNCCMAPKGCTLHLSDGSSIHCP
ncbi:PREDICTED: proteinase inhibitor PSI-1.2 isoform X2 [Tarenaya hassleriana]|uniref:proteinase inhibitor PSI-1.2 isoform X2 n=1 Tax=Tarenaya hassleriana TaxID=28532 RepID=UPI00053C7475|nr:PREDICTED: proteinase inhibitor PSI-1.2 isoform X2 [Tarenaya hassleriana]